MNGIPKPIKLTVWMEAFKDGDLVQIFPSKKVARVNYQLGVHPHAEDMMPLTIQNEDLPEDQLADIFLPYYGDNIIKLKR